MCSKLDEFELIKKITRQQSHFAAKGMIGPGDDCAVFDNGFLITTDTLLEDTHFKLQYSSYYDIGWKALAVSLSDIAAMGGVPIGATVAIQIPETLALTQVEELYRGVYALADKYDVAILGGDTVRSDKLGINTTVVGKALSLPILRSGARDQDDIWLSNQIGLAQLGLDSFENNQNIQYRIFHQRPEPRLELAKYLAENKVANSMLDVSDGLFQDLMHICKASSLRASLVLEKIPSAISYLENPELLLKLCASGDDYELLFSANKAYRTQLAKNNSLSLIGEFSAQEPSIYVGSDNLTEILKKNGISQMGYSHF